MIMDLLFERSKLITILYILETENILCSFYEKYIFKRFKRKFEELSIKKYGISKASKIMKW